MTTITLIRHGQANNQARDEASYDKLSELGHQQAAWLGEHLSDTREHVTRFYTGTMRRHIETGASMGRFCEVAPSRDARVNEVAYMTLASLAEQQLGLPVPADREDFAAHMPRLFSLWQQGRISAAPESFETFEARIDAAIDQIAAGEGPALVVTSAAVISMIMRRILGLDLERMCGLCLAIMNSSVHRLHPVNGRLEVMQFNALPHLDRPERHHARTHL